MKKYLFLTLLTGLIFFSTTSCKKEKIEKNETKISERIAAKFDNGYVTIANIGNTIEIQSAKVDYVIGNYQKEPKYFTNIKLKPKEKDSVYIGESAYGIYIRYEDDNSGEEL